MGGKSFIVPHGCTKAQAYLCMPLDDAAARRSTALATLMDFEGIVELPCDIDVSYLWTWARLKPEQARMLSLAELSLALKLGDHLGDKHAHAFAKAMGNKLARPVSDCDDSNSLKEPFSSMNSNLKALVVQHVEAMSVALKHVVSKWPLPMQKDFCSALIEIGSIEMPYDLSSIEVQAFMSIISKSPTSKRFTKLSIATPIAYDNNHDESPQRDDFPCTISLVSDVLIHHWESLSSVHLHSLQPEAIMTTLPAINHLSQLTSLLIGMRLPCITPENHPAIQHSIDDLATTISRLTTLAAFSFHTECTSEEAPAQPSPTKRRKICSKRSIAALSLDPLIQALSIAPSLTSLSFLSLFTAPSCTPLPCSGIRGPFQTLQELSISFPSLSLPDELQDGDLLPVNEAHSILPAAPLSSLTSLHFSNRVQRPLPAVDALLVRGLVLQTSLQFAHLHFHQLTLCAASLFLDCATALTSLRALVVGFSDGMQGMPYEIHIAVQGITRLHVLTRLELEMPDISATSSWAAEFVRTHLLAPLSSLTDLESLQCRFLHMGDKDENVAALPSLVRVALPALTLLTRLSLVKVEKAGRACNLEDDAVHALPRLPLLQDLELVGLHLRRQNDEAFRWLERICPRQLTNLDLAITDVTADMLQCLGRCLQHTDFQCVQRVTLRLQDHNKRQHWMSGLLCLPAKGEYKISFSFELRTNVERCAHQEVVKHLQERGFVVDEDSEWRLWFRIPSVENSGVGGSSQKDAAQKGQTHAGDL